MSDLSIIVKKIQNTEIYLFEAEFCPEKQTHFGKIYAS